jgi:hypothetical protein
MKIYRVYLCENAREHFFTTKKKADNFLKEVYNEYLSYEDSPVEFKKFVKQNYLIVEEVDVE